MTTKTRPYVGVKPDSSRELFRSNVEPTRDVWGHLYLYVIGPFKTVRGARFMRDYGKGNPHCQWTGDAEALARIYAHKP